jgi:hypothetical protein
MKQALLAAAAVAALVFPGLAATAATTVHASSTTIVKKPVHQMLGAQLPFIRTGRGVGHGYILKGKLKRTPRPQAGFARSADVVAPSAADNLTYGGPDQTPPASLATLPRVMTSNTNYLIFWIPNGYRTASNYVSLITQYFHDIASDSGGDLNVDSTDVQYMGSSDGEIYYDSSFGDVAVDTNPFPKSACMSTYKGFGSKAGQAQGHLNVEGLTACLSDTQIGAEVKRFADEQGWPHGPTNEFFVYTPHNVGSCFWADGRVPGGNMQNQCSYDWYCAYHSNVGTTPATEYIYANMPWPNQAFSFGASQYKSDCDAGEHPNGDGSIGNGTEPNGPTDADAADEVLNVTSHEHNESITDPTGYGWWVDAAGPFGGYENGDLCAWYWAADGTDFLGTATNGADFTNVINGHDYFLQGEWSNDDATGTDNSGCQWSYPAAVQPDYAAGTNTLTGGPAGVGTTLTLTAGDFTGLSSPVYEFEWIRCSPDAAPSAIHAPNRFALGLGCHDIRIDYTNYWTSPDNTDTYKTTTADVGYDIYGAIYADAGSGDPTGELVSSGGDPVFIPVNVEPEYTVAPSIAPNTSLTPGVPLTISMGTWTNTPTSFSVQLQHCTPGDALSCVTFKTVKVTALKTGVTTTRYAPTVADSRFALNAVVTAANKAGVDNLDGVTGLTDEIAGYPVSTGGAGWSAAPVAGTNVTINFGTWGPGNAPPTGYTVQVDRCAMITVEPFVYDENQCESSATLTATGTKTGVTFKPTLLDDGQALVATIVAKNKYGVSDAVAVVAANVVDGEPVNTLAPSWESTAASSSGDPDNPTTVTLDMGTWAPAATEYSWQLYACDGTSHTTSTCVNITPPSSDEPNRTNDASAPITIQDLGREYHLFAYVEGINAAGFSTGAWTSNSVDVDGS